MLYSGWDKIGVALTCAGSHKLIKPTLQTRKTIPTFEWRMSELHDPVGCDTPTRLGGHLSDWEGLPMSPFAHGGRYSLTTSRGSLSSRNPIKVE
jgi:hypothetical protein